MKHLRPESHAKRIIEAFEAGRRAYLRRESKYQCFYKDAERVDAFERGWTFERDKVRR